MSEKLYTSDEDKMMQDKSLTWSEPAILTKNKMETATIQVKQTISHYGFFGNDHNYGEHDPEYRQWVKKTHLIDWDDYECGCLMSDSEMLEDFCTENNKSFEFIFCEEADGFYKVDKK